MTAIDCNEARSHLPLFAGGDLEPPLDGVVREHLASCEPCAERLEAAAKARRALLSLRGEDGPVGFVDLWPGIRARLAEEGLFERGRSVAREAAVTPVWNLARFRLLTGAAAAAVLALLAWRPWVTIPSGVAGEPGGEAMMSVGDPAVPEPVVLPVANRLRRAEPGDELLRDSARDLRLRGRLPAGQTGPILWSLASDEQVTDEPIRDERFR